MREAEDIANIELSKISSWAKDNKTRFNEQKSKVMLMTRRKKREHKDMEVYLNHKLLEQVYNMKYLGITIDYNLTYREHITYVTDKCKKLIFSLSKSAKLYWGLNHAALLLYVAHVWAKIMDKTCYRLKINRVQRLINIKIAKAYRTVSNEALSILTGLTPISIKIEEVTQLYQIVRRSRNKDPFIDHDKGYKYWLHPAVTSIAITDNQENTSSIQIFTDGSKSEHGVGAGIAVLKQDSPNMTLKYRLNTR